MPLNAVSRITFLLLFMGAAQAQQFSPTQHEVFPRSSNPEAIHCFEGTGGGPAYMAAEDCSYGVSFWSDVDVPRVSHAHVFYFDASSVYQGGTITSLRFFCEGYFSGANNTNPALALDDQYELTAIYQASIQVLDPVSSTWTDLAPTFLDTTQVNLDGSTIWNHGDFLYADQWTSTASTAGPYAGPIDQTLPNPGNLVAANGLIHVRIQFDGRVEGNGYDCNLVMDEVFIEFVEGGTTQRLNPMAVSEDDQYSMFVNLGNDGVANLAANDGLYNVSWFQDNIVLYGNGPNGPYELGDIFTFDISSLGLTGGQITDLRLFAKAFFSGGQSTANQVRRSPSGPPISLFGDDGDEIGFIRACVWDVYDHVAGGWDELGPWLVPDKRTVVANPGEATPWDPFPYCQQWVQPAPLAGAYAGPIDLQAGAVFNDNHLSTAGEIVVRLRWIYDAPASTGEHDSAHFFDLVFVEVNGNGGQAAPFWPSWCGDSQGFARLSTSGGIARPGNAAFALNITGAAPTTAVTTWIGLSNTALQPGLPNTLPLDLGPFGLADCYLAVSTMTSAIIPTDLAGNGQVVVGIPANSLFTSGMFYLQGSYVDLQIPPPALPIAFTNAIAIQFQP